ncbi:AraC family transcriptional regulator [Thermomonas sp. HDW16]|uniref:helix-turn-helix transcriptional regulator n=1 Tax=Thermomonas sp. HDW16 TaxID=2714945 RepID=UPI00140E0696|nr:AraC family transcriptional regulator [Thermomonas sp. HDW16]QIL20194.1 AraC family transcriptional regulator [Thermomonas sp. HDW16]
MHNADAFFEVFESARVKGGGAAIQTLQVGQPLEFSQVSACFHFIEGAPCRLHISGYRQGLFLQTGDLVVLPHGGSHKLEYTGDGAAEAKVTTCDFRLEGPAGKLLVSALPALLHVTGAGQPSASFPDSPREWLSVTLAAIRKEADRPSLGSVVMLSRLIDLLFVWSLRHWLMTSSPEATSLARALDDSVLSHALVLLHAQPARNWSVDGLASELNQSRSNLSQRFVETLGEPPMRYLTRWRMQLAAEMLVSSKLRISLVAERVGYGSEPAFSRAFKRQFGTTPTDYRIAKTGRNSKQLVGSGRLK